MTARAGGPPVDRIAVVGRTLALLAAGAVVLAAFLPWDGTGRTAVGLAPAPLPWASLGLGLVVVAALPSLAAVVSERGWPRGVAAAVVGAVVLAWLGWGPDGALATGVATAMGGAVGLAVAAALGR